MALELVLDVLDLAPDLAAAGLEAAHFGIEWIRAEERTDHARESIGFLVEALEIVDWGCGGARRGLIEVFEVKIGIVIKKR